MPPQADIAERFYSSARRGSMDAFEIWVGLVEPRVWRSLRSFAASVDVEGIVQETLVRMWVLAPRMELTGKDASLRYALRLARNLAISEARRRKRLQLVPSEELEVEPDESAPGEEEPDDELRAAVQRCIDKLPDQPRRALEARMEDDGESPDRTLAGFASMAINTFHKNLSRARALMAACLGSQGVELGSRAR